MFAKELVPFNFGIMPLQFDNDNRAELTKIDVRVF